MTARYTIMQLEDGVITLDCVGGMHHHTVDNNGSVTNKTLSRIITDFNKKKIYMDFSVAVVSKRGKLLGSKAISIPRSLD